MSVITLSCTVDDLRGKFHHPVTESNGELLPQSLWSLSPYDIDGHNHGLTFPELEGFLEKHGYCLHSTTPNKQLIVFVYIKRKQIRG